MMRSVPSPSLSPLGDQAGAWVLSEIREVEPLEALEEFAKTRSVPRRSLLCAHVEDSDYAYASTVFGGEVVSRILFNEKVADGYQEGRWAIARCTSQATDDWRERAAERLSAWSSATPRHVEGRVVLELTAREWTFAESAIDRLLDALQLPLPIPVPPPEFEGAVWLQDRGRYHSRGRDVNKATARYVLGSGVDFHGLWDRQHPGPAISRFPKDPEGWRKAHEKWDRLVAGRRWMLLLQRFFRTSEDEAS
jgi:hypothetical protein